MKSNKVDKVCVVGVGFVGLTFALALCREGVKVLGWEKSPELTLSLSSGLTEISEPGIEELLANFVGSGDFTMITEPHEAVRANTFIITVGTPLKNGIINLEFITEATQQILPCIKDDDLVIIRSTTAVGVCRSVILPILEQSGKRFRLAMCPERTIEGKALEEMSSLPQIIGALDEESSIAAKMFFSHIGPEIVEVDSLEAAELTKLINNTFRDLMFAYGNEVAEIAGAYGVNATQIINAANHNYPRSKIALPGLSGGPCLEKDPWILVESGKIKDLGMEISKAARIVNENTLASFLNRHLDLGVPRKKIAILGLAFKGIPETRDLRGSFIFPLAKLLGESFPEIELHGFDPSKIKLVPGTPILISLSLEDCLRAADLVVILTNSPAFSQVPKLISKYADERCLVLDYWSRDFTSKFLPTQKYISWGSGSE
jgi:UDP-N-acetyl-D-mannosaminuronic acid dehydrogenase